MLVEGAATDANKAKEAGGDLAGFGNTNGGGDHGKIIADGASSHDSKGLKIPGNSRLHRLPSYSPELGPTEHLWDEIREKSFPNRVFSKMGAVIAQIANDLPILG